MSAGLARWSAPALALALALAPGLAAAQQGLDLSEPEPKAEAKKKDDKKKEDAKKREDAKKKEDAKKAPAKAAPARTAPSGGRPDIRRSEPPPSAPAPAQAAPTAPAPRPAPAPAQRPSRSGEARPSDGLDLRGRVDARPRLEAGKKLLEAHSWEAAAQAYDEILREPGLADAHDEARYQLAKALEGAGLHHAALTYLDEILERGPTGSRFFHSALERLFVVGQHLGNEQPLLSRVARFAREVVPPAEQDRAWFLLSKYEFERARALDEAGRGEEARTAWREARRLAGLVRPEAGGAAGAPAKGKAAPAAEESGDVYARAQFIDGLALYALKDETAANEKFKEVVRLTNPRKNRSGDAELRELAFLQLARLHYQNRQNRYAIFYYGKMPWGGPQWLEGLWEASYAHYRIGEHEKALGNLLTLQSAYFKDEYFPESWVLKAIIYYENCRYPEARLVLEDFNGVYEPLYDELVALTARGWAPEAFLAQPLSGKVRKLAFTDQNIRRLAEAAHDIDAELERGVKRSGLRDAPLGKALQDRLTRERRQLLTEAGLRARGKLEYERDQLRSILAQAERIRIEVSRQEREALEGSLAAGSQVEVVKDLRWTHAVSDEHLFWPYEGEFWRDELGTYSYTLTKGCKDRPPRSGSR